MTMKMDNWIKKNTKKSESGKIQNIYRRPDIILDVNYKKQYKMFEKLYDDLYKINPNFNINDIIKWYDVNMNAKEN